MNKIGHLNRRRLLLATAAFSGLAVALSAPAAAQTSAAIGVPDGAGSIYAPAGSAIPAQSIYQPNIVISDPGTPTTALDPNDVTGIGQMVIDQQNGFIGLCTGTLINPRTVIFASHCVNETPDGTGFQDPWGYGAASGGLPIAFGFRAEQQCRRQFRVRQLAVWRLSDRRFQLSLQRQ